MLTIYVFRIKQLLITDDERPAKVFVSMIRKGDKLINLSECDELDKVTDLEIVLCGRFI
jgi:hypothetical protein